MRILRQVEAGRPVFEAAQDQMLDGVEPDRAQAQGVLDSAADVGEPNVLEKSQHRHVLARPRLAQPSFQQPPQPAKRLGQRPPGQRCRLIERPDLALQQGQVVSRLENQRLPLIAATMPGDFLAPAHDHDLVHKAFHTTTSRWP